MNRHERRAAQSRKRTREVAPGTIDSTCDIQVDGKVEQIVMIFANAKGRKVVEDLWPDVEWTTDEIFSRAHSLIGCSRICETSSGLYRYDARCAFFAAGVI